jgi:hypothetical protein
VKNTHLLLLTVRFTQKQSNAEAHQIKLIEATVAFFRSSVIMSLRLPLIGMLIAVNEASVWMFWPN